MLNFNGVRSWQVNISEATRTMKSHGSFSEQIKK